MKFMRTGLALACVLGGLGSIRAQETCEPVGKVRFVCLPQRTEDLVVLPDSAWTLTSGVLTAINTKDGSAMPLFSSEARHDRAVYGDCPQPLANAQGGDQKFHLGGLSVRRGQGGVHRLYALHRGTRASVEVFDVDVRRGTPAIVWIGCVLVPSGVSFNSLTSLPDHGIVATNFLAPQNGAFTGMNADAVKGRAKLVSGMPTGELWEWQPKTGWAKVPGSEASGPNGVESSLDGKWLYFDEWATKRVVRLSRGQQPVRKDSLELSFHPDNLHRQQDGSLLTAGQGPAVEEILGRCLAPGNQDCTQVSMGVARINPQAFKAEEILRYPAGNGVVRAAAAAAAVGGEIWVTDIGGPNRIARIPAR